MNKPGIWRTWREAALPLAVLGLALAGVWLGIGYVVCRVVD